LTVFQIHIENPLFEKPLQQQQQHFFSLQHSVRLLGVVKRFLFPNFFCSRATLINGHAFKPGKNRFIFAESIFLV